MATELKALCESICDYYNLYKQFSFCKLCSLLPMIPKYFFLFVFIWILTSAQGLRCLTGNTNNIGTVSKEKSDPRNRD